jgi:hypothetical protein
MSRIIRSSLFASLAAAIAVPSVASAESYTTRIEPQPFHGATVTIEHNVRVYRPLPTVKHVIINPNRTPLNLSYAEVIEHRQSHNYFYDNSGYPLPAYGGGFGFPHGFHGKPNKNRVGGFRPQ